MRLAILWTPVDLKGRLTLAGGCDVVLPTTYQECQVVQAEGHRFESLHGHFFLLRVFPLFLFSSYSSFARVSSTSLLSIITA